MHVGASMAANNSNNQLGGLGDYFLDQILVNPSTYVSGDATAEFGGDGSFGLGSMALQLGTGPAQRNGMGIGMPLGLNLEHGGFFRPGIDDGLSNDSSPSSIAQVINERDAVYLPSFYPAYGQLQPHAVQLVESSQPHHPQLFHSQQPRVTTPNPPAVRHRIRARRGQATDPHSIAERVRRERITDRVKVLQELVPSVNKTDRATMVDEIVDYVKFLRLQVQVLSMSRLGGTGSVVQLASDVPLSSAEGASNETITSQPAWEKWSADGAECQVAELMEKDVGAAMQFLQSKALCIMPLSLASSIFHTTNSSILLKSESNAGY